MTLESEMKPFQEQTYYELLEIPVGAAEEEIRAAFERQSELYAADSVAIYALEDPAQAEILRGKLREAMEILTDPDLREEYDRTIGLAPPLPRADRLREDEEAEEEQPTQLAMAEVIASAEARHSTHPELAVSYVSRTSATEHRSDGRAEAPRAESSRAEDAPREERSEEPRGTEPRSVEPRSIEPRSIEPRSIDPRGAEPRGAPASRSAEAAALRSGEPSEPEQTPAPVARPGRPLESAAGHGRSLETAPQLAQESAIASAEAALAQVAAKVKEVRQPPAAPAPRPVEIPADAEFNGELLRRVREARGVSLAQVADKTRISARHLENIEADRYKDLPVQVYLRGILMTLAREYGLDPLRVSKSYLALTGAKK